MHKRVLRRAMTGALALTLIGAPIAFADNIVIDDGDIVTADGVLALGEVCIASPKAIDVPVRIDRSGSDNKNVFANSALVGITGVAAPTSDDLSITGTSVTTPINWYTGVAKDDQGKFVDTTVGVTVTPSAVGSQERTVTLTASGMNVTTPAGTATRIDTVQVTWTGMDCAGPTDVPPTVSVDSAMGDEGSDLTLTAKVTDDGASPLSFAWSYKAKSDVDAGASCSFADGASVAGAIITCTDDGIYEVTLTVTDGTGPVAGSADVTVDNVAPSLISASFGDANLSCGTDNAALTVSFTDAGTNDTHTVSVDWDNDGIFDQDVTDAQSGAGIPHTFPAGVHKVSVKVTDDDGDSSGAAEATAIVDYTMSGILQPINTTGSRSLFKYGSTIPVKVQILECDGSPALGLSPVLKVQKTVDGTPSGIDETLGSTSAADSGNVLRYSGADGIYIFNLATKTLADATASYEATVTIPSTGQFAQATFGLKK